jgi:hypothetical protein
MPNAATKSPPTTDNEKAILCLPEIRSVMIEFRFGSCTCASEIQVRLSPPGSFEGLPKQRCVPKARDYVSANAPARANCTWHGCRNVPASHAREQAGWDRGAIHLTKLPLLRPLSS